MNINDQLTEILELFHKGSKQCLTPGETWTVFQTIKMLHSRLLGEVNSNPQFNEITHYLGGKTNCMNICGGVCENICQLNESQFDQFINRNNLHDKLIALTLHS